MIPTWEHQMMKLGGVADAIALRRFQSLSDLAWLPSDLTGLFTTATGGANPVPGDPVGFMANCAGQGGKSFAQVMAGQPELVTNGDFNAGSTGWIVTGADASHIITFADGKLRYQSDTTSPILSFRQSNVLTVGKWYYIEVECSNYVSGSLKTDNSTNGPTTLVSKAGKNMALVKATSEILNILRNSTNVDLTIDSISIKEIPSLPFSQTTAGARPILVRYPKSRVRIRLTAYSYTHLTLPTKLLT